MKLREVIGFKTFWGHLTAKNDPSLHPGSTTHFAFPTHEGEPMVHPLSLVPYMEANVGIHNILKFLRIDYVYRINYHLPGTKRHGVRFGAQFDF